jgi:hypothetical protein
MPQIGKSVPPVNPPDYRSSGVVSGFAHVKIHSGLNCPACGLLLGPHSAVTEDGTQIRICCQNCGRDAGEFVIDQDCFDRDEREEGGSCPSADRHADALLEIPAFTGCRRRALSPVIKQTGVHMSDELKNSTSLITVGDGLDGYTDAVEGDERPASQGLIQGTLVKFGNTAEWQTKDGEVLDHDTRLIILDLKRAIIKWGADKKPEETRIIPPGQPFPDVAAMNEAIPKTQWRQGFNGLEGPWQPQQCAVMLDPHTMEHFTFATSATGGFIAIRELADKVKAMRRYRGPVSPIVTLDDAPMKTRYGDRRRPYFTIVDWVRLNGGSEPQQAALPAPRPNGGADGNTEMVVEAEPKAEPVKAEPVNVEAVKAEPIKAEPVKAEPVLTGKFKARARAKSKVAIGESVAPLTMAEELNDELPW